MFQGRGIVDDSQWSWISHHAAFYYHLQISAGKFTFVASNIVLLVLKKSTMIAAFTILDTRCIALISHQQRVNKRVNKQKVENRIQFVEITS